MIMVMVMIVLALVLVIFDHSKVRGSQRYRVQPTVEAKGEGGVAVAAASLSFG